MNSTHLNIGVPKLSICSFFSSPESNVGVCIPYIHVSLVWNVPQILSLLTMTI